MRRNRQVKADLERLGWRVITVWEYELREPDQLVVRLEEIEQQNRGHPPI
ncbi:MAG: hypothetical protein WC007_15490 [Pelobacteraceae bacterium]